MSRRQRSPPRDQADRVPQVHNRLFILGGKNASEDEFRDSFSKYGDVEDVWSVKDKKTGESKGITYVTMTKTSEACLAQEEMNGRILPGHPKPLKVMIAADREQGNMREEREDEKLLRIFVKVPKSQSEEDVETYFRQWGDTDYVSLLTDKHTGKSRGLAYIKYYRAYCAAMAVENCDREFKAVFAKKKQKDQFEMFQPMEYRSGGRSTGDGREGRGDSRYSDYGGYGGSYGGSGPLDLLADMPNNGENRLEAMASTAASQEQIYRLFDLVPGLEYCDFDRHSGIAYIQYSQAQCAAYAKEKMNGFEYPPGFRISVRFPPPDNNYSSGYQSFDRGGRGNYNLGAGNPSRYGGGGGGYGSNGGNSGGYSDSGYGGPNNAVVEITNTLTSLASNPSVQGNDVLQTLVQTMSKATNMLQKSSPGDSKVRTNYCNVPLPEKQAMAPKDHDVIERLFIVSQPSPFPDNIMKDAFCRFGGLIDAHFMAGRNYGYAKFTNKESASIAIATLHAQEICGMRLKVMLADPPKHEQDETSKRAKMDTR